MARTRVDKGVPACPQHPDGWVVRNGLYGQKPRQRQRWRCAPADGSAPHNFAGNVVRSVRAAPGSCEHCEQHLERHQGPGMAALYRYPVTEVALALVRVGRGMSYTDAARRCRARQARDLYGPEAERTTRAKKPTAQLVANWVEVFGPVVAADYAATRWPETVIVDDQSFTANTSQGQGTVFSILAAYGYEAGETRGRLLALRAVRRGASLHNWAGVFGSLAGEPRMVITDHSGVAVNAIPKAFPNAAIRLCRYHLKEKFFEVVDPVIKRNPTTSIGDLDHTIVDSAEAWEQFKLCALDPHIDTKGRLNLGSWIHNGARSRDDLLLAEFAAGELPDHWGNGPVEQVLYELKRIFKPRAFCYRNAERTNRLLELMRLHHNGVDDMGRYATAIRDHLHALHTGQLAPQGVIRDPRGAPSLR